MIKMAMFARHYRALAVLGFALFLAACGNLGMVLPSQGSYRVNAQVDDDYTLDTYSVVTKNSDIRPYFVNSVVNDPDVRGITVFVQDYSGVIVSRKVQYLLDKEARQALKPPEQPETPGETSPVAAPQTAPEGPKDKPPAAEEGRDAPDEVSRDGPPEDLTAVPDKAETAAPDSVATESGLRSPGLSEGPSSKPSGDSSPETAKAPEDSPGRTGESGAATGADTPGLDAMGTTTTGAAAAGADLAGRDGKTATTTDITAAGADGTGRDATATTADITAADADPANRDAKTATTTGTTATGADAAGKELKTATTTDSGAMGADTAGRDAKTANVMDTTAADADAYLPALPPVDIPNPPIPEDETIIVKQLDQYLPAFRIIEELDIGRYNLVFQVMGEKEILYRTFKPIYFIGDARFTLEEIQSFLPIEITGGRLIPPGINVMLETEISSDPRLDPYIIWHNGKKILAQGRLSEGANYLLWKTPEQTGFHSIRAEVFPLLPGERIPGNMIGKIKELSLPVSSRSEGIRHFSDPADEFINWYQFWGALDDTKAPNNPERRLVSPYAQAPRWTPFGGIYGLLVGRDNIYTLPGTPFKLSADEQGTGRILLRLAALSEGSIFTIRFAGGEIAGKAQETADEPLGAAELDLSFAGNALILRIASNTLSQEQSLALDDAANGFMTVSVEFTIAPDHFDAELRLENPPGTTGLLSIALAAPLSGDGSVTFGEYSGPSAQQSAPGAAGKYGGTMALNELALSYTRAPIPQEEEESGSDFPETLSVEEEELSAEPELPSPDAL